MSAFFSIYSFSSTQMQDCTLAAKVKGLMIFLEATVRNSKSISQLAIKGLHVHDPCNVIF